MMAADVEWTIHQNEHQRSVNDFWFWKYGNYTVIWSLLCITDALAALLGKRDSNMLTAPFWDSAWMEHRRFLALHLAYFIFRLVVDIHLSDIAFLQWEKLQQHGPWLIVKMSVKGASTIFLLHILRNSCSDWFQISTHQKLTAFTGKNNSDMLPVATWKWASFERQQLQLLHSLWCRHRANLRIPNGIIDRPETQKYHFSQVKHLFQIGR